MGLIFTDGFDAGGTSNGTTLAGLSRKWPTSANTSSIVAADGRLSGKAAYFFSTFTCWAQTPTFAEATLTVGLAVRFTQETDATANGQFLGFYENNTLGINLRRTPTGEMAIYFGSTQLAVTTTLGLALNVWATVELSVTVHNSAGAYDLHVNGASVLSASGIDTQAGSNAWTDVVRIGKPANSVMLCIVDDFYVNDDGTFLIDWKIQTVFPTGDAGPNDGTPSTGSDNFAVVDENPANADTDYVAIASGDENRFSFPSVSGTNVVAVVPHVVCRETDASPFDVTPIANQAGTPQAIGSTDYVTRYEVFETNPDTGLAWEVSEVNGGEYGFEIS